jgi:hypothetical protein
MKRRYDLGCLPELGVLVNIRTASRSCQDAPNDVGTLWTMRRLGHSARCALIAFSGDWELRVLVDGEILLAERCPRGAEAFAVAELWKRRMLQQGWHQVVPNAEPRPPREAGAEIATFRTP